MTAIIQPHDQRGFFMLPQAPADAGYYVYGNPGGGINQYAHPRMMSLILAVEREWQGSETRQFGVGDISAADGPKVRDHNSHRRGLEVDIRPVRKDGLHIACTYQDSAYDRNATEKLINLFRACAPNPILIFFNDMKIPGVRPLAKHDHHFHVQF
ncbi:MAG TPA: penicillin-insensitive murein endopeptidase [Telluria sp.]|nr:penicillin-insensitive murein endopeptidase [Telluria sp.]